MSTFKKTHRNKIRRKAKRGQYDRSTIYSIVDEGIVCHVGFVQNRQPFVIPTVYARVNDSIIIHGSRASRLLNHMKSGRQVCIAITMLDGVVLARSAFHHSVNYRSVVLFGRGKTIEKNEEKLEALEAVVEHIMPGRWQDAREPNRKELNATAVVSIPIDEVSAKIRTGPPVDDSVDYDLPIWAGIIPIGQDVSTPKPDTKLLGDIPVPEYVVNYRIRSHNP